MYFENKGTGKFAGKLLPDMAQVSAIHGMQCIDINQDGNLDILFVGNNYANEVSMGRYDASNGGVLLGNGKGNFTYIPRSGLLVPQDAKSLVSIQIGKEQLAYVALQNRGPMHVFVPTKPFSKANVPAGKDFSYTFKGQKQKIAWTYGASYLSQSGQAQAFIPKGAILAN